MSGEGSVFRFLEDDPKPLPKRVTVERTQQSKYQFFLVSRHYRKRLSYRTRCLSYTKAEAPMVKAAIEEHSLFETGSLYVLEGFSLKFVESLILPKDTYVLAETDGGLLRAERCRMEAPRDLLRVLIDQLGIKTLKLGRLLKQDWTGLRGPEEFEPILRRAAIMGWDEEETGRFLKGVEFRGLLTKLKRSDLKGVFELISIRGATWTKNHLFVCLAQLLHYRVLIEMGYDGFRAAKDLGIGYYRREDLEQAIKMIPPEEIVSLCRRAVELDFLMMRNEELGLSLFFLNNPIRVRR